MLETLRGVVHYGNTVDTASRTLGNLYGVGVGPGNPDLLTVKAGTVFDSVDRIFYVEGQNSRISVSRSVVEAHDPELSPKLTPLVFSMAPRFEDRKDSWARNADTLVDHLEKGLHCAFATIGDPLVYSTFAYLLPYLREALPDLVIEIVPGITSFQAAAALAQIPLAMDSEILAVVPSWKDESTRRSALEDADSVVFLKTYRGRTRVVDWVGDHHDGEFAYGSHIGRENQYLTLESGDLVDREAEYLSLVISRKRRFNVEDGS